MDDAGKKAYEEELRKVQESKTTITIKLDNYPKTQDSEDDTDDEEYSHMVSDPLCKLTDIIQRMAETPAVERKLKAAKIKKLRVMVSPNGLTINLN
jgi:hypothetical protein